MISILFFYCNNRLPYFLKTIKCLENVELYQECQKIVCSDGKTNFKKDGYTVLEIERPNKDYNWAKVWNAGIQAATQNVIWYLDCDRVVPTDYLSQAIQLVNDDTWVYPNQTFHISKDVDLESLVAIQEGKHRNLLKVEERCNNPPSITHSQPGKNPISGNTLLTKTSFIKSGGLNPYFEGYGYADLDYYMKMHHSGVKFVPIGLEYHQNHPHAVRDKRDSTMMYYNGLLYCKNWGLQPHEPLASNAIKHNVKTQDVKRSFHEYELRGEVKLL